MVVDERVKKKKTGTKAGAGIEEWVCRTPLACRVLLNTLSPSRRARASTWDAPQKKHLGRPSGLRRLKVKVRCGNY